MDVRNEIKSVVFKEGITHLGNNMLTRSYNMVSVDASECTTLKTVGTDLFKGTGWDQEPAGSSLESINFSGCNQLTTIGKQAFRATNLETVDFSGCSQLNSFGDNCFADCTQIKTLNISGTKLKPSHITTTGAGFGSSKSTLQILKANGCTTDFTSLNLGGWTILQTVELSDCTNLTSLTVPSGVTTLDISGCTGLDSLDLSAYTQLTTVKVGNRDDHTDLSWLTLPASVTTLDASGFTSLTSLDVPASVTSLNVSGCTGLNSLNIPSSVTTLNASGCTGLSVLDLSETSLTNIDVSNNASLTVLKLPASVSTLDVTGCTNLVLYFDGKKEDLPELPATVSVISWGDYTYTIAKNGTDATLDEIFAACNITAIDSADVQSISASDPNVLQVTGLTVKSLQSFTESQTLTVTLKNGMTGTITVVCEMLEESDNLNLFLDDKTVYSYEGEEETHAVSVPAIAKEGDGLNLTLSFSEIPEGEEGERQMKLLLPMKYTFPAELTVTAVTSPVTLNLQGSASTEVRFTVPVSVQVSTVPHDYVLGNGITLSAVKAHNVKVSSFKAGDYSVDSETGTITVTYTAEVEADNDLDYDGNNYPRGCRQLYLYAREQA